MYFQYLISNSIIQEIPTEHICNAWSYKIFDYPFCSEVHSYKAADWMRSKIGTSEWVRVNDAKNFIDDDCLITTNIRHFGYKHLW